MVGEEDYPDEVEERLVNEEYKIWKKNTPFLYGRLSFVARPSGAVECSRFHWTIKEVFLAPEADRIFHFSNALSHKLALKSGRKNPS